jgi:microbial collagenase
MKEHLMRHRSALPRFVVVGLAACATTVGLIATPTFAGPAPKHASTTSAMTKAAHGAARNPGPLGASIKASDQFEDGGTADGQAPPLKLDGPQNSSPAAVAQAAAQSCTPADFGSRTGSALVTYIQNSTIDCIGTLFTVTGTDASNIFRESQMVTVANAFQSTASTYPGDNSTHLWQLSQFLRGGYYVQYNNASAVGTYGPTLAAAVEPALDTFFASPHFPDVTSGHGDVLGNVIALTDSANEQARYLSVYKQVLNAYNSAYDAYPSMVTAVNAVFGPVYRGHFAPAYIAAVTADPSIIDTLNAFALNHRPLLAGANWKLDTNAGAEAVRFLDTPALQAKVRPLAVGLLNGSAITGANAALWVRVATVVDYVDNAECATFGTCDLPTRLSAAALPTTYTCGATRTILAQSLTAADLAAACTSLQGQDPYYHNLVKDSGPIPGQYETNVRLAVFATKHDYEIYSTGIFGNSTDNGGQTLDGTITDPANQPVSVMYIKFAGDGFPADVWNLNHEYTHLLQAAYDFKGDFGQQTSVPDIWWIEGQAEYVSYSYRGDNDTQAINEARLHSYPLSTLFQTTYANTNTDRTYNWGYLAVRYMIEKHPADVQAMLTKFRAGNYNGAYSVYNSIGTRYDADFNTWLDACAAGACLAAGAPTSAFTAAANGLSVNLADASTDTGSTITLERWSYGDGTVSTTDGPHPTKTYAAPGTYTVALTVTDAKGLSSTSAQTVTVTSGGGTLPTCPSSNVQAMDKNCSRANQAASAGNYDYLWIYLPAGTVNLTITTTGGTGNADLYYNPTTWATTTAYTAKSTNTGTTETLTVTNTTAGYRYLSLYAATTFSGVTVTTQY